MPDLLVFIFVLVLKVDIVNKPTRQKKQMVINGTGWSILANIGAVTVTILAVQMHNSRQVDM